MSLTKLERETPEGRLCIDARRVIEKKFELINEHREKDMRMDCPWIPTASDFFEFLGPRIKRELLTAAINQAMLSGGSWEHVQILTAELKDLKEKIAENPL